MLKIGIVSILISCLLVLIVDKYPNSYFEFWLLFASIGLGIFGIMASIDHICTNRR